MYGKVFARQAQLLAAVVACVALNTPAHAELSQFDTGFHVAYGGPDAKFNVSRDAIKQSVKIIGLAPPRFGKLASTIAHPDLPATLTEKLLTERLSAAGYEVVPSAAMQAVFDETLAKIGDLYDRKTGKADELKIKAYRQAVLRTYFERNKVDALVFSGLAFEYVQQNKGKSTWDGVEEAASGFTGVHDFFSGANRQFAKIPALSIYVAMSDKYVNPMWIGIGGLHALQYIRPMADGYDDYVDITPTDDMFSEGRIGRAIDIACDSLAPLPKREKENRARTQEASIKFAPSRAEYAAANYHYTTAADFKKAHHQIALTPLLLGGEPAPPELRARFAKLLTAELSELGYAVVQPDAYIATQERIKKADGVHFDPKNGEMEDTERLGAQVARDLASWTQSDAILSPEIDIRTALFMGAEARWDGASQIITGDDTALAANLAMRSKRTGTISTLSLRISLHDADAKQIYYGIGGIELLNRFVNDKFVRRPNSELFKDDERNAAAVKIALDGLIEKPKPAK